MKTRRMKMILKTNVWMSLAAGALGMLAASTAQGQAINWGAASNITGDTDVSTTGTPVFAYDWDDTVQTVNGVTFTAPGPGVTFNPQSGLTGFYNNFVVGNAGVGTPASHLSVAYQDVLTGGQFGGTAEGLMTLNNLTLGHNYAVQIWVDDSRSGEDSRTETVSDTVGGNVGLEYNAQTEQGGLGQFTIGTFTADSSTNLIVLQGDTAAQINAIQLRDLGLSTVAAPPVFNLVAGSYFGAQTVTITGESGATVFYTTDGSTPSQTSPNGGVGTGSATVSIPVSSTVTINAYETNIAQTASSVARATYSTYTPAVPTWILAGGGSWPSPYAWADQIVGEGAGITADFSTLTVSPGAVITCDSEIVIGNMIFGDQGNANPWEIDPGANPNYNFVGTLTLAGTTPTITVQNQSVNITVPMGGVNGLTVASGSGTLDLTAQNTYTGGTTVNGGATLFANGPNTSTGAVGSGDVSVLNGGTIYVGGDNSFVGSSTSDILSVSIASGGLISNTNAVDTTYLTNFDYSTNYTTNLSVITTNITTNILDVITNLMGSSCHLNALVLDGGTLSAANTNSGGTWLLDFGVFATGDGRTSHITGGDVALTQSGGTVFEILGNDTVVLSTTLDHTASADNGFVKLGTGTLTLNDTTNTSTGNEAVNGGTLNGNGQTSATLTVNSGGTLAPGTPAAIGQLGFTNLVLKAGANVQMRIDPTDNTNDSVVGDVGTPMNTVTYGGTLTVTNIGGTLALNDSFQLFYAKKYSGAFANYNLPTLPGGLHWNVGQLTVNGNLTVVSGPSAPTFNPTAGGFMTPQVITISDLTPGATIYYTTDGSTPSSSSTVYSSAINVPVPTNMTINAIAYVAGVPSEVSSGTFVTTTTAIWNQASAPSASWSVAGNWSNGIIANLAGGTADFSRLTLTNNPQQVTLDGNWTIGNMIFGDVGGNHSYEIEAGTGTTALTLAGTSPTITLQNANPNATNANLQTIITANVAGSNGWTIVGTPIPSSELTTSSAEIRITAENLMTGGTIINGAAVYDNGGETSFGIFGRGNLVLTNGASIICNGSYWSMTGADPSLVFSVTINDGCTITNAGGQAQIVPNLIMDGGVLSAGNGNANGGYGAWGLTGNVTTLGDGKTSYMLGGGPNNGDLSFLAQGATVFNIGANDTLIITMPFDVGWKNQDNGWIKNGPGTMEMDASISCQATNVGTINDGLFRGTATLINGAVIVNPGGTIGAGTSNAVGTLTLGKSLTLSPGSFTMMRIDEASNSSDQINLTGTQPLYFGGTLIVTNLGGTLVAGDSFTLFTVANNNFIGNFDNYILPSLATGLSWDTSQLLEEGTIDVVSGAVPPTFNPPAGGYNGGAQQITMSTLTPGATIYYTTDGTTPTTGSASGTTPVTVIVPANVTVTIQAFTHETGWADSAVSSATFTTEAGPAVWANLAGGSWSITNNWSNNIIANQNGGSADFSQLTLTSNTFVTLNSGWATGSLIFGDVGDKYNWEVDNGTNATPGLLGGPLTLENGTNTPTITVNNGTATINASIISLSGLNKTGPGTLLFAGNGSNVWGHFHGLISTSGGPLVFSNNATQEVPPDGVTGTGPVTFVGQGINFLGNVTTGGNQTYITGPGVAYEINGGYIATNCFLKATNGASITVISPCLGYKNSNGGSLTVDTSDGNGTINLNVSIGGGALYFPLENLTANAGTGTINYMGANPNANDPLYANVGDRVPPIETLTGAINFSANYVANVAIQMYLNPTLPSIASGNFSGALTLWVSGPSTLTMTGTNTYTGTTTVTNGGTLLVNGRNTGGAMNVASGATLGGTGEVGGPTTVLSGGTLEAGGVLTIGHLSLGDSLTLSPGSTTVLRIEATTGENDAIAGPPVVPIVINYGGTLTVNNIGGILAAGDSFQLFSAASYNGNFSTLNLPVLNSGLAWNWAPATGTLSVVTSGSAPVLSGNATFSAGSFSISFSGPNGQGYSVLTTTNLALPLADWTQLTSGTFGANPVNFTDIHATNTAQFYRIVTP